MLYENGAIPQEKRLRPCIDKYMLACVDVVVTISKLVVMLLVKSEN